MNDAALTIDPNEESAEGGAPFQHLHPLSIILKSVSALGQNLILMAVLFFSLFDQNILYTGLAAIVLIGAIVGVTALIWSRFTYQIGTKEIRIKSGLFNRNNRSIPFDRIQDVSLEQKLLGRVLGLATVKLETGSGGGEDGTLDALKLTDGDALRDVIRDFKSGHIIASSDIDQSVVETDQAPLFAMDNRRILIAGIFNFSFILLAVLGTIAQNLDFLLPDGFFDPRNWIETIAGQDTINSLSLTARIGGVLVAIGSLIAVGVISGIIRTFIREYGFRLDHITTGQPGFRRRRGLFTLTDMVMPIHRVQAAIIATGPIRQIFGWYHLKFQSLAGDQGGQTDHSAAPCARTDEISPILTETEIDELPDELVFESVNHAYWWRDAALSLLLFTALALGLGIFFHAGLFALILIALPIAGFCFLSWQHHQYALSPTQLFVRTGWWRRRLTMLPVRKIQTIDVSQSPLDHPLNLATVTIGVAGGSALSPLKIMDIPLGRAMLLREQLT